MIFRKKNRLCMITFRDGVVVKGYGFRQRFGYVWLGVSECYDRGKGKWVGADRSISRWSASDVYRVDMEV